MGEAARPQEHLLLLLPASVPDAVIDDLRKSFPHFEITHLEIALNETLDAVPRGMHCSFETDWTATDACIASQSSSKRRPSWPPRSDTSRRRSKCLSAYTYTPDEDDGNRLC